MTNASPRHLLSLQTGCKNSARWLSRAAARRSGGRGGDEEDSGFLVWNEEVKFFERLLPPGAGVTCGSVEDEVKSEALHRRWFRGENEAMHAAGAPFLAGSSLTHITTSCLSAWNEEGNDETLCVFSKSDDWFWEALGSPALHKYLPLYRFPQLHILYMCMCVYTVHIQAYSKRMNRFHCAIFFKGKVIENSSQVTSNLLPINFYLLSDKCSMWPPPPTSVR